ISREDREKMKVEGLIGGVFAVGRFNFHRKIDSFEFRFNLKCGSSSPAGTMGSHWYDWGPRARFLYLSTDARQFVFGHPDEEALAKVVLEKGIYNFPPALLVSEVRDP